MQSNLNERVSNIFWGPSSETPLLDRTVLNKSPIVGEMQLTRNVTVQKDQPVPNDTDLQGRDEARPRVSNDFQVPTKLRTRATSYSRSSPTTRKSSERISSDKREARPTENTEVRSYPDRRKQENEHRVSKLLRETDTLRQENETLRQQNEAFRKQFEHQKHQLAELRQREAEATSHFERQNQRLVISRDELQRAEADHEITRTMLRERVEELQDTQRFINPSDSLSGAEVMAMANALNAEILQAAAFISDSLDFTIGQPPTPEQVSAGQAIIGRDLTKALLAQRGRPEHDPTIVQLALQTCFVNCCKRIIESWALRGNETLLHDIYEHILKKDKQVAVGRWRSMIQGHATSTRAQPYCIGWITQWTAGTLHLAGWSPQGSETFPANLQERLSMVITLVLRLRTAVGENITSMDIVPFIAQHGSKFDPKTMDDTYAEGAEHQRAGERVAGSTELGLCSRIKVGEEFTGTVMMKPKVILASALNEEESGAD